MEIDITQALGTVKRSITSTERDGVPARVLTVSRAYPAGLDHVWETVTNPDKLSRWFLPVSGDLREGGTYQFEGNASGTILKCAAPNSFEITWEYGGMVSWVEVKLASDGEETMLTLEHTASVPDELWSQWGPGAVGIGWDLGLMGLDQYFRFGEPADKAEALRWPTTPDGKVFVRAVSEDWARASIAAGTDPAEANAAGEAVIGFYTVE